MNVWNISDVSDWLHEIELQQYISAFAQNEINGSILLDINLEDMDYMRFISYIYTCICYIYVYNNIHIIHLCLYI